MQNQVFVTLLYLTGFYSVSFRPSIYNLCKWDLLYLGVYQNAFASYEWIKLKALVAFTLTSLAIG